MILGKKPLSMAESLEYVDKESGTEVKGFIKKFTKLKPKDGKEMRAKFEALDYLKMNDMHVSKLIDVLPETKGELNKIFSDVGLDEDESKQILDIIKEYK